MKICHYMWSHSKCESFIKYTHSNGKYLNRQLICDFKSSINAIKCVTIARCIIRYGNVRTCSTQRYEVTVTMLSVNRRQEVNDRLLFSRLWGETFRAIMNGHVPVVKNKRQQGRFGAPNNTPLPRIGAVHYCKCHCKKTFGRNRKIPVANLQICLVAPAKPSCRTNVLRSVVRQVCAASV